MAYKTILSEKQSSTGSPYCFYTVSYEEKARTSTTVKLGIKITAHLQYSNSYFGYSSTGTLTVGGKAFSIKIKGNEMWSGTANHTVTKDITVSASAGTTSLSAKFAVSTGSGHAALNATTCSNITISRYYTAASISASGAAIGSKIPITLSGKYPSDATCTVAYKFGTATGTVISNTTSTSLQWDTSAVKASLLSQIPSSKSGTCTLTCTTKYNGSNVGSDSCSITLSTAESVSITSLSVKPYNTNAFLSSKGLYVAGYTKAEVTVSAKAGAGSSISSYSITGLGGTGTVANWDSPLLTKGDKKVSVTVTDARKTSASASTTITVLDYSSPTVTLTVERGTASGTDGADFKPDDKGKNLRIKAAVGVNLTANGNRGVLALKLDGSQIGTYSDLQTTTVEKIVTSEVDDNIVHEISAQVTDSLGVKSTEFLYNLPTARVNMSMLPDNKGVTFGGHPVTEGLVSEFPAKLNGGISINLSQAGFPAAIINACSKDSDGFTSLSNLLLNFAYPVGSYYWSSSATSPATLFGGTWTQISDRFVLAAGSTYKVGATGGASTVKLTVSQMPAHTHTVSGTAASKGAHTHKINCDLDANYTTSGTRSWSVHKAATGASSSVGSTTSTGAHTHTVSGTAASAGGSGAHENMPPYIVAYCWRRTA